MATYTNAIQKLYVAYFNRPADVAGLAYWEGVVTAANGSTTAVSAAFAGSAEYNAEYGLFNTTGTLTQIYHNLFGHAPDAAGLAYWVKAVTDKVFTIDAAVTQIAAGAQGTDKDAYDNKVTAATAFTAALDTAAEADGYKGDLANEAAKDFLAGITTNASLTAALVPATLAASVADVIKAGVVFTLDSALKTLAAANDAKTAFLVTADGDKDATTTATEAELTASLATKAAAIQTAGVVDYSTSTPGVAAAKLADQIDTFALALVNAQKAEATAAANVAKVTGLASAVANFDSADAALIAANKVVDSSASKLAGDKASYQTTNATHVLTINANGTVSNVVGAAAAVDVIVLDGTKLVLKTGVTEVTNPGIGAVLAASIAKEAADKAAGAATTIKTDASTILDRTDVAAGAADELVAVGAGMTIVSIPTGGSPTGVQIKTEVLGLTAAKDAAQASVDATVAAGGTATTEQNTAVTNTTNALNTFNGLLTTFTTADGVSNPLYLIQSTAHATTVAAGKAVDKLDAAVAASAEVKALIAQLEALDDAIDAAGDTFTDHDFAVPVTLTGFAGATADADIFLVGEVNSTIVTFAQKDMLFIGAEYTLNAGKIATDGKDAVLEVFLTQSGADVKVTLETKAFGSNSADAEIVITLTGTNLADVHYANGIITV